MPALSTSQIQALGGFYFVAPASDPNDRHSAGADGNMFATPDEAEESIPGLRELGEEWDHEWVVRWCDHVG